MSYIIDGVEGRHWHAANWIVNGMSDTLLEVLREKPETEKVADELERGIEMGVGYADLSHLLEAPELSDLWSKVIDETLDKLRKKGNAHWHEPSGFEEFLAKVAELKTIALVPQTA